MTTQDDLMQTQLNKAGTFRAYPVAWTLEPSTKTKSVAIKIGFAISSEWCGDEAGWSQEWPPGWFISSWSYVVGRDGTLNEKAVEQLIKAKIWDGDFDKVGGPVAQEFVLIDVSEETYEGKSSLKVRWINPNADKPSGGGGFQPVDTSLLTNLRSQFGSATRAIAGRVGGGGGAPAPPGATQAPAPAPAPVAAPVAAPPAAPAAAPPPTAPPVGPDAVPVAAPVAAPAAPPAPGAVPGAGTPPLIEGLEDDTPF